MGSRASVLEMAEVSFRFSRAWANQRIKDNCRDT
jgi:hypothetical protein